MFDLKNLNKPFKMYRIYRETLKKFLKHDALVNSLTPQSEDWFEGPDEKGDKMKNQLSGMAKVMGLTQEQRAKIRKEVKKEIKEEKRMAGLVKGAIKF